MRGLRTRTPNTTRTVAVVAAVVGLALAAALLGPRLLGDDGVSEAAEGFADAWTAGDDRGAARLTDAPGRAAAALRENRGGLDGAKVRVAAGEPDRDGDRATVTYRVWWSVPGIGPLAYRSRAALRKRGDDWKVHWRATVIHPELGPGVRLGTTREPRRRGAIEGRDGRPLMTARPVQRVGVVAGKVRDPRATARALAGVVDVDPKPLERAIRGGGRQQFVEAIALRERDYQRVEAAVKAVPGATVVPGTAQLAPSRAFARALLGGVGPATAEQLKRLGKGYAPGDEVGQWGLQSRFERRLRPTADRRVVLRADGVPIETLVRRPGRAGRPLRTTLDQRTQAAAESALGGRRDEAALVAIKPSNGDVLAVANRPVDSTYNRALEGNYPPGSTFKVVSTAALLERGLDVDQPVPCPRTLTVDGRSFKNFEGGGGANPPFATDFADSCNTAFVSLAPRLPADALRDTGKRFGLGQGDFLRVPAARSQVPPGRTKVERAASMIGQARILTSPLAMAGVAGTVAAGVWHPPSLTPGDGRGEIPLERGEAATLRRLMRGVVTDGSGTALAGLPGQPAGKSGTAEYGGGDPPPTHAWFIAFRGDLAVAVLVENGRAGGTVAAPIAARFFGAL